MASTGADQLDRRRHHGPLRFIYMDIKAVLRRLFSWL